MSIVDRQRLSIADFIRHYAEHGPFEIIDGEIVAMPPHIARSANIAGELYFRLRLYLEDHPIGQAYVEAPFVLTDQSDWVRGSRVPDVMFYRAERLRAMAERKPDWDKGPLIGAPDLAVEVVSPTDVFSAVNAKIQRYLADGVQQAWVIDPEQRTVSFYPAYHHLSGDATLNGGDLLPGFELALRRLWQIGQKF